MVFIEICNILDKEKSWCSTFPDSPPLLTEFAFYDWYIVFCVFSSIDIIAGH